MRQLSSTMVAAIINFMDGKCHIPKADDKKNQCISRLMIRMFGCSNKAVLFQVLVHVGLHFCYQKLIVVVKKTKKTRICLTFWTMNNLPEKKQKSNTQPTQSLHQQSRHCRHLIYQLKIIASLKKNDRINTTNGLYIQNSIFQSIQRWYTGENRVVNLSTLESIFDEALEYYEHLLQQIKVLEEDSKRDKQCKLKQQAESLKFELEQSLTGLSNLAFTYKAHADVVAKIYTLSQHVGFHLRCNF